jgi:hypothetical protein
VFTEVFIVQIHRKLRKIYFEVRIQGKKNFGRRIPNFKIKRKKGNPGEEVWGWGGGEDNFSLLIFKLRACGPEDLLIKMHRPIIHFRHISMMKIAL